MAYNPFDEVIENDPAYKMQFGGVQPMVIPQQRPDYTQETFKPIATSIARAYKLLTPEQETLDQIEKDQQLRSLATQQAFQGTEFDQYAGDFDLPGSVLQDPKALDLLNQAGFKRESFTEGLSRIGQFFYGNQRKAFDKLRDGQDLTSEDRLSIALAPLDSLDFLLPPVAIKKLAGIGLKNVNSILRSTSDLPEVQQVKQFFGGSPVPLIQDAAKGPPGMQTTPRVALAADDGTGVGKVDLRKDPEKVKQIKATKLKKTQEELFEPYRQNLQDYLAQTNVPSAKGFYNYLTDNKIPLTLEKLNVPGKSIRYKPPQLRKNKNISTETEHLKEAVDYLTEGKNPLGQFRPEWTGIAEKILEGSDKKLTNKQIYDKLIEAGVTEAQIGGRTDKQKLQRIQQFTKKDYLSDAAKKMWLLAL
jgi:hypothetical protein